MRKEISLRVVALGAAAGVVGTVALSPSSREYREMVTTDIVKHPVSLIVDENDKNLFTPSNGNPQLWNVTFTKCLPSNVSVDNKKKVEEHAKQGEIGVYDAPSLSAPVVFSKPEEITKNVTQVVPVSGEAARYNGKATDTVITYTRETPTFMFMKRDSSKTKSAAGSIGVWAKLVKSNTEKSTYQPVNQNGKV